MADAAGLLQQLGFGEYEARAYIALLQRNPLNGYEVAKTSGIPRANIYDVLQRLEERNAVTRVDTEGSVRYVPVPPDQLIPEMGDRMQHLLQDARCTLETMCHPVQTELSRNILGYAALIDQARYLINAAQEDLVVGLWPPEVEALADDMARAEQRGVRLITLCLQGCTGDCPGCRGTVYRYHLMPTLLSRWMLVVQDGCDMLMGEIGPSQSTALRTSQQSLIQMAIHYIRSSVAWAAVVQNMPEGLNQMFSPEAQRILRELGPAHTGWLSYMRELLSGTTPEGSEKSAS